MTAWDLEKHRDQPAGNIMMGLTSRDDDGKDAKAAASLRFVPNHSKTEDYRYHKYYYIQLASSEGKAVPGFDYFAQERTTIKTNKFTGVEGGKAEVQRTDHEPLKELPRSGLFRDRVGLYSQPSSRVSGTLVLDQRFVLKYRDQEVPVSTVLRHITQVTNGQVRNSVIVLTP
jgi:hypothetical protein